MTRTYTFVFDPEPEGGYTVTCPALPGLVSYGETLKQARAMAQDAMDGLIEVMLERGEPVPESDAPVETSGDDGHLPQLFAKQLGLAIRPVRARERRDRHEGSVRSANERVRESCQIEAEPIFEQLSARIDEKV